MKDFDWRKNADGTFTGVANGRTKTGTHAQVVDWLRREWAAAPPSTREAVLSADPTTRHVHRRISRRQRSGLKYAVWFVVNVIIAVIVLGAIVLYAISPHAR
jgi:hypothetical protein